MSLHLSVLTDEPDIWLDPLNETMRMFEINTASRIKMYLAQVAHESAGFKVLVENLNYSAARLLQIFPRHFTPEQATDYAMQPERIANRVYARMNGNGDEESGDGWCYRGRGLIQLTSRGNYSRCGRALSLDLIAIPELLEQPTDAARSSGWFWYVNGCNELADHNDFEGVTKRINGGLNGMQDRLAWLSKVEKAMA